MAFNYYMNMEIMFLENAESHAKQMTNSNMEDDIWCNQAALENNLKNGWVVVISLCTYFESFLNSILRDCMGYDSNGKLMRTSIDNKLEIIFMHYNKDLGKIKAGDGWEHRTKLVNIRNELVHYKKNCLGYGGSIPSEWNNNINIPKLFTQKEMQLNIKKMKILTQRIADELNLQINESVNVFSSDGHDHTYYIETNKDKKINRIFQKIGINLIKIGKKLMDK